MESVHENDPLLVWVESHVVRAAGGLNRSPNSTSSTPGHDTHTIEHYLINEGQKYHQLNTLPGSLLP
eukprot:jgi/Chrzof1/11918/Cz06g14180.t1